MSSRIPLPSGLRQVLLVSRWVLTHPSNRGRRLRRYARAVAFQLLSRVIPGIAIPVRLGTRARIFVARNDVSAMKCLYANPPDPEMNVWAQELRYGDLFIDVGANSGSYTLWAADHGATVIAIEPDGQALERLRRNIDLNGYEVQVIAAAASDQPGTARFTRGGGPMNRLATEADVTVTSVPVCTLDEVVGDRYVAGIKIDVEGAEHRVLLGARRALREGRIGLLQLEWNGRCVELLGETRDPVRQLLEAHGYHLYRAGGPSLEMGDEDVFAVLRRLPTSGGGAATARRSGGRSRGRS